MSTVADVIAEVRLEVSDPNSARWSNAQMSRMVAKAVRRVSHIVRKNEIPFGRSYTTITTVAWTDEYDLPDDFMAVVGLFRDATHVEVAQTSDADFERIVSAPELAAYCIRAGKVKVTQAPTAAETLTLIYWPLIDTSGYGTGTTMPWDGKLDDIIAEYVALRCKNIDEQTLTTDAQLLTDLENNILLTYGTLNPTISTMRGWLPTTFEEAERNG